jgi:hypothetical protein
MKLFSPVFQLCFLVRLIMINSPPPRLSYMDHCFTVMSAVSVLGCPGSRTEYLTDSQMTYPIPNSRNRTICMNVDNILFLHFKSNP